MADHFQLSNFDIQDAGGGNIVILVSGSRKYYAILRHAFSNHHFSRAFDDRKNKYNWGTYIYGIAEDERRKIDSLMKLFERAVCIDDALSQTFALSYHSQATFEGIDKTEIGKLVYSAKPYHQAPSPKHSAKATELAKHFETFILNHPSYKRSDYIIAVPCNAGKRFDLPSVIVQHLCSSLNMKNGQSYVRKVTNPAPMKDCKTVKAKTDNILGAFEVLPNAPFQGSLVTIIDDIYESGATLHELATTLQRAGATVQGLVATKTLKDPI